MTPSLLPCHQWTQFAHGRCLWHYQTRISITLQQLWTVLVVRRTTVGAVLGSEGLDLTDVLYQVECFELGPTERIAITFEELVACPADDIGHLPGWSCHA